MNLVDNLIKYYGIYPEGETEKKIKRLERKPEDFKQALFNNIIANNPKNFGFPDVSAITKAEQSSEVKESISESSSCRKYWAKCQCCGQSYSYDLFCCPVCWENNRHIMSRDIVVSETGIIPEKVVRYNLTSPSVEVIPGKNCFSCADRKNSFCSHFGKLNWNCQRSDWEYCQCRQCCAVVRKQNEEQEKKKLEEVKQWYNQF